MRMSKGVSDLSLIAWRMVNIICKKSGPRLGIY